MLSQYDQSIYDAGYKYIPQSRYLLNPFEIPGNNPPDNNLPRDPGLPSINIGGGGGGGEFSPYNPNMNQIRQDYSPFAARQYFAQPGSKVGIPSGMLADSKFMYGDQIQLPGILGMGQEFLKKVLPINQRAILENEARGKGIFTDDIGRVVSSGGNINTGANIMAGYNLNKVTQETLEKRRAMIEKNMKDPVQKKAKLDALDEFEEMYFGPYGAKTISTGIYKQRKDKKDAAAAAAAAAKQAEEEAALQAEIEAYNKRQAEIARRAKDSNNDGVPDYVQDAGGTAPGNIYSTDYQGTSSPSNVGGDGGGQGGGQDMGSGGTRDSGGSTGGYSYDGGGRQGFGYGLADGGRVYYMDGGRVAYMLGGLTDLVDIYD